MIINWNLSVKENLNKVIKRVYAYTPAVESELPHFNLESTRKSFWALHPSTQKFNLASLAASKERCGYVGSQTKHWKKYAYKLNVFSKRFART